MVALERQKLLEAIFEGIQNKENCIPHAKVVAYHESEQG